MRGFRSRCWGVYGGLGFVLRVMNTVDVFHYAERAVPQLFVTKDVALSAHKPQTLINPHKP